MHEYGPLQTLLRIHGASIKEIISYTVDMWLTNQAESAWCDEKAFFNTLCDHIDVDFFYETRFGKIGRDVQDAMTVAHKLALQTYAEIPPTLEVLHLPDFVTQILKPTGWKGDALMIST